jgi:hypothetical protein
MAGQERSYRAIRKEEGKADVVTSFASTASFNHMAHWCEEAGRTIVTYKVIETPHDEKFVSTTIFTVRRITARSGSTGKKPGSGKRLKIAGAHKAASSKFRKRKPPSRKRGGLKR